MRTKYEMNWLVGPHESEYSEPEKSVPAVVPGAVQLDWARAEGWGDYSYAESYKQYDWMEDRYWTYTTNIELDKSSSGDRLFFVCKGIDYRFTVRLDGEVIHEQEGMFTPFELDLTDRVKDVSKLSITVYPAPKRNGAPIGRQQADQSCKPAVSYGWDWHPRLIPLGIWDETYLEFRPKLYLTDSETSYSLNGSLSMAELTSSLKWSASAAGKVRWRLTDRHGSEVIMREATIHQNDVSATDSIVFHDCLHQPELWWPNGQGEPILYTSVTELFDENETLVDRLESRIGFRTVKLVMHPKAWEQPITFPKTQSTPPITMEINGRAIFCKGTNWVNPEIFPGIIQADTYRPLLQMAKDAHMNMLRVWGGGIVNKDSFFDQCDELGLMVWQEFPLACNNYESTPEYLQILDQESKSIIRRVRRHASHAMWCGGNELFNNWSGMTEQSLALRLLNRNCFDLDPGTPFLMTSPVMGMGHGHYRFKADGIEVYQLMSEATNTAYTEFGCPGPASADYLRGFIPPDELFPPRAEGSWKAHHAFDAWQTPDWLNLDIIEHYFGQSHTLEQLTERGQWLQAEGYKCIFEEARRQKPTCSMALNWCYNEPWPTAANNSLLSWPAVPKKAYYAVQASCRPALASAKISKFSWKEGEWFDPELWILNDLPSELSGGTLEAWLEIGGDTLRLLEWGFPTLKANTNAPGPVVRFPLPPAKEGVMRLVLKVHGRAELDSEYSLYYRQEVSENVTEISTMNL